MTVNNESCINIRFCNEQYCNNVQVLFHIADMHIRNRRLKFSTNQIAKEHCQADIRVYETKHFAIQNYIIYNTYCQQHVDMMLMLIMQFNKQSDFKLLVVTSKH